MNVNARIAVIAVLVAIVASGCRFKGIESFVTATTPHPKKDKYEGDKYSDGGLADSTGGVKVYSSHSSGAKKGAEAKMNTAYDTPAKGTGQQPGENPGKGGSNGPVMQGSSSVVGSDVKN
jgi:hypothetical protein